MASRRNFLKKVGIGTISLPFFSSQVLHAQSNTSSNLPTIHKPISLKAGDTVGVIAPAGVLSLEADLKPFLNMLQGYGLNVILGKSVGEKFGYLAGNDALRAQDLNEMFANPDIDAIFAARGGWGSARMLQLIDFELIKNNPKIFIGYSDITTLLLAFYTKVGLVSFHGPVGLSTWSDYSKDAFEKLIFKNKSLKIKSLYSNQDAFSTITEGKVEGILVGGNLSVLCSLVGSEYLPDWEGKILFLEDIGEEIYRIDRMLTQLSLAGILSKIKGFIFGQCTNCAPAKNPEYAFSLEQILDYHIKPLKIPAFFGAKIGHISENSLLPIGIKVKLNANKGTIKLKEKALF